MSNDTKLEAKLHFFRINVPDLSRLDETRLGVRDQQACLVCPEAGDKERKKQKVQVYLVQWP